MDEDAGEIVVVIPSEEAWIIPLMEGLKKPGESLEDVANRLIKEAIGYKIGLKREAGGNSRSDGPNVV